MINLEEIAIILLGVLVYNATNGRGKNETLPVFSKK